MKRVPACLTDLMGNLGSKSLECQIGKWETTIGNTMGVCRNRCPQYTKQLDRLDNSFQCHFISPASNSFILLCISPGSRCSPELTFFVGPLSSVNQTARSYLTHAEQ